MKSKLIRNLKVGEYIQVKDGLAHPFKTFKVMVVNVEETERGHVTGDRRWKVEFLPHLFHGSWRNIVGYANDRVPVYPKES